MTDNSATKMRAFAKLKDQLIDKYGANSVMLANEIPVRPTVSSGSLALDFATGIRGLPSDRCVEVAGAPGVGKSTVGLLAMSNFLDAQPDRGALILDLEHKVTASWVEQLIGPDRMSKVILAWADSAEQATDMYTKAVASGQISFVLYDSIGGAPSQRVTEKSAEIGNIGGNALAITRFAQLASIYSQKYHCCTLGINQTRDNLGYGGGMSTPGGHAWRHACVIRIQMRRGQGKMEEKIGGEIIPVGYEVVARIIKNQLAPPGRVATFWLFNVPTETYPFGIDKIEEIVRLSLLTGVVQQDGSMYSHPALPGGKIRSRDAVTACVRESKDIYSALAQHVLEVLSEDGEVAKLVAPLVDPDIDIDESVISSAILDPRSSVEENDAQTGLAGARAALSRASGVVGDESLG